MTTYIIKKLVPLAPNLNYLTQPTRANEIQQPQTHYTTASSNTNATFSNDNNQQQEQQQQQYQHSQQQDWIANHYTNSSRAAEAYYPRQELNQPLSSEHHHQIHHHQYQAQPQTYQQRYELNCPQTHQTQSQAQQLQLARADYNQRERERELEVQLPSPAKPVVPLSAPMNQVSIHQATVASYQSVQATLLGRLPDNYAQQIIEEEWRTRKPFISKLSYLLRNPDAFVDCIQWNPQGTIFILAPSPRFIDALLEIYSHGSPSAFTRQLNTYGFQHLNSNQLSEEFSHSPDTTTPIKDLSAWKHPLFLRDQPELSIKMRPTPSKARQATKLASSIIDPLNGAAISRKNKNLIISQAAAAEKKRKSKSGR